MRMSRPREWQARARSSVLVERSCVREHRHRRLRSGCPASARVRMQPWRARACSSVLVERSCVRERRSDWPASARVRMHLWWARACSSVLVERSCVRERRPDAAASSSSSASKRYTSSSAPASRSNLASAALSCAGGSASQWLAKTAPFHANGLRAHGPGGGLKSCLWRWRVTGAHTLTDTGVQGMHSVLPA